MAGEKEPSAYIVSRDDQPRTADKYGLSHAELPILSEAAHEINRIGSAVFFSIRPANDNEPDQQELISSIKKRIGIEQSRLGAKPYRIEVLEADPSLHAHLIVSVPNLPAANDLIDTMNRSVFGPVLKMRSGETASKRVSNWGDLVNYLSKEATPQAWAKGGKSFRRKTKAERSGSVSGDRVRLSKALERRLVGTGKIAPRRHTYAARKPKVGSAA